MDQIGIGMLGAGFVGQMHSLTFGSLDRARQQPPVPCRLRSMEAQPKSAPIPLLFSLGNAVGAIGRALALLEADLHVLFTALALPRAAGSAGSVRKPG
jgi:hypothetical protein